MTGWALVIRRAPEATTALDARFPAATFVVLCTGFGTETGNAGSRTAITIGGASCRRDGAADLRIANGSGRACALSYVIDDFAHSAIATHVRNSTGICFDQFIKSFPQYKIVYTKQERKERMPTCAFIIDTSLACRASGVVSTTDDANAIKTDMTPIAEAVAVTNGATSAIDASRIRQASLITISTEQLTMQESNSMLN